jgi:hypothetical protein
LGFTSRAQYESAIRKLLADDPRAVTLIRKLLGSLPVDLVTEDEL